jgi:hypothetical protein
MGKKASKPAARVTKKAPAAKPTAKTKSVSIEQACKGALEQLQSLNIEHGLQADLGWCLGSYQNDGNPVGLYEMGARALKVFNEVKTTNSKAIPARLISDLEKALKGH